MNIDLATLRSKIAPILYEHIDMAYKMDFFKHNEMPYVEELYYDTSKVCKQIHDGISDYYTEEEPDQTIYDNIPKFMAFCAYAGMGAVVFWYNDNNSIRKYGIYETLTKERGVFDMDEYVFDYLGIGYGSDRQQEISHNFRCLIDSVITKFMNLMPNDSTQSNFSVYFRLIMEASNVMYKLGMIYQMQAMGHREEECISMSVNMLINISERRRFVEANYSCRQLLVQRLKEMVSSDMPRETRPESEKVSYENCKIQICMRETTVKCDKCGNSFTTYAREFDENERHVTQMQSLGYDCMLHNYCESCAKASGYNHAFLFRFENSEPYIKTPIDGYYINDLRILLSFLKNENRISKYGDKQYVGECPEIIERMIGISRYE